MRFFFKKFEGELWSNAGILANDKNVKCVRGSERRALRIPFVNTGEKITAIWTRFTNRNSSGDTGELFQWLNQKIAFIFKNINSFTYVYWTNFPQFSECYVASKQASFFLIKLCIVQMTYAYIYVYVYSLALYFITHFCMVELTKLSL